VDPTLRNNALYLRTKLYLLHVSAVASKVNIGRVGMIRLSWNAALIDEFGSFPLGQHDDLVDALALAFAAVVTDGSKWARWRALAS
jgi:phage terminase large subunit-like protein